MKKPCVQSLAGQQPAATFGRTPRQNEDQSNQKPRFGPTNLSGPGKPSPSTSWDRTRPQEKATSTYSLLFTRWVEAFLVKGTTTKTTVKLLENEVFCRWGYPQAVITDNGTQFKSNHFKRACHRWRIRNWLTANYHPRANPTERRNQEIKKLLRVAYQMFPGQPWDRHLAKGLFNIRRRRNATTGQLSSDLLMRYDLRMPGPRPPAMLSKTIHPLWRSSFNPTISC
jgi:hypothetical protein